MTNKPLITLASSSPFRKELLTKLFDNFNTFAPEIDETPLPAEGVKDMVARLSLEKAQAVADKFPEHLVIASDQSAELNNQPLGKPENFDKALEQLKNQQGKTIKFYTGLAIYNPLDKKFYEALDVTKVTFRQLSESQLINYLNKEKPFNTAGSFKSEGLGIALFDKLETQDPNALVGLPLIELTKILDKIGLSPI